jgi:hypothetical protein
VSNDAARQRLRTLEAANTAEAQQLEREGASWSAKAANREERGRLVREWRELGELVQLEGVE